MLFDVSLPGFLVCFGPLALTILGFIFFAAITDADARRTYLRRLEETEVGPINKAINAETPAGVPVTILPPERVSDNGNGGIVTPDAKTDLAPQPVTTDIVVEPDDLTRLEGIGAKMAAALVAGGLDTFEKVAAASLDDFRAAIEAAGMSFAPAAESWAEQASYAAKGDWDGLAALQDTLISGRYPSSDE